MIDTFQEGLFKVTKKYGNIVMLYGDEDFAGVNFFKFFADRSFNLGLGEQNLISAASGFTVRGKMPLIFGKADMVLKADAQIRDNICVPNLNVKLVVVGGGDSEASDVDSADVKIVRTMPNIRIMCPQNGEEILLCLEEMVNSYGPVYFRMGILQ